MNIFVIKSDSFNEDKKEEIKRILRMINFLDDAKYYAHKSDILDCLKTLYYELNDEEELNDFLGGLEDRI